MSATALRDALTAELRAAMRERDRERVRVLRQVSAAIDNAGAIDADPHDFSAAPIGTVGLGSGDAARRALTDDDLRALLAREAGELRMAATELEAHGRAEDAAARRRDADHIDALAARHLDA